MPGYPHIQAGMPTLIKGAWLHGWPLVPIPRQGWSNAPEGRFFDSCGWFWYLCGHEMRL